MLSTNYCNDYACIAEKLRNLINGGEKDHNEYLKQGTKERVLAHCKCEQIQELVTDLSCKCEQMRIVFKKQYENIYNYTSTDKKEMKKYFEENSSIISNCIETLNSIIDSMKTSFQIISTILSISNFFDPNLKGFKSLMALNQTIEIFDSICTDANRENVDGQENENDINKLEKANNNKVIDILKSQGNIEEDKMEEEMIGIIKRKNVSKRIEKKLNKEEFKVNNLYNNLLKNCYTLGETQKICDSLKNLLNSEFFSFCPNRRHQINFLYSQLKENEMQISFSEISYLTPKISRNCWSNQIRKFESQPNSGGRPTIFNSEKRKKLSNLLWKELLKEKHQLLKKSIFTL